MSRLGLAGGAAEKEKENIKITGNLNGSFRAQLLQQKMSSYNNMLLVIYFDYCANILKRLDEHHIKYVSVQYDDLGSYLRTHVPTQVIITGSIKRIMREHTLPVLEPLLKQNINIIGICFGFQYLAIQTGGKIVEGPLFIGRRETDDGEWVYFNHYDRVVQLSKKWKILSRMDDFINIAATKKWVGFQFHPEKDPKYFKRYLLPLIH